MSARITAITLEQAAEYLTTRPQVARRAARMAVNDTTRRKALPIFREEIQKQVAFPAGYVNRDRFDQTRQATDKDLTAAITARFRPTSLARFAGGQNIQGARRAGGVRVRVNPGGGTFMRGAFFVQLRRGGDMEGGGNLGLAIRLKPGQKLRGRRKGGKSVQLAPNLYLLYGPSIDQVFRDASVAKSPEVLRELEKEFTRQWIRLQGAK